LNGESRIDDLTELLDLFRPVFLRGLIAACGKPA
jgi:hypothetical protein